MNKKYSTVYAVPTSDEWMGNALTRKSDAANNIQAMFDGDVAVIVKDMSDATERERVTVMNRYRRMAIRHDLPVKSTYDANSVYVINLAADAEAMEPQPVLPEGFEFADEVIHGEKYQEKHRYALDAFLASGYKAVMKDYGDEHECRKAHCAYANFLRKHPEYPIELVKEKTKVFFTKTTRKRKHTYAK